MITVRPSAKLETVFRIAPAMSRAANVMNRTIVSRTATARLAKALVTRDESSPDMWTLTLELSGGCRSA
jgi:hypothetical protein